jgi:hypothetical protein
MYPTLLLCISQHLWQAYSSLTAQPKHEQYLPLRQLTAGTTEKQKGLSLQEVSGESHMVDSTPRYAAKLKRGPGMA